MAEFTFPLSATSPLGGVDLTHGQNRIRERPDLAIVSVATPQGGDAALTRAFEVGWSLDWPTPTISTTCLDMRAIRTSPDQVLLVFPHASPDAERHVAAKLDGAGYTTEQTDAWVVLDISGPNTRSALERLCPIDFAEMPDNGAARTVMEHMGAILLRLATNQYWLMSASSSARSFLHAVETSFTNISDQ